MDRISQFLVMGGYAGFIWPALGIAAAVLAGLLVQTLRTLRARESEIASIGGDDRANPEPGR
jgi:heme exporter protein CcmD